MAETGARLLSLLRPAFCAVAWPQCGPSDGGASRQRAALCASSRWQGAFRGILALMAADGDASIAALTLRPFDRGVACLRLSDGGVKPFYSNIIALKAA